MTELVKRKIDVELFCNSISDTGSAASPAEDEVWLALERRRLGHDRAHGDQDLPRRRCATSTSSR